MKYLLLALALTGCGTMVQPVEGKPGTYQLHFCAKEKDCFEAAKRTCPNGYRITRYGNTQPERFVCKGGVE